MAEGTKDLSKDAQKAVQLKPSHKIVAIDPDTGMAVYLEPDQLAGVTESMLATKADKALVDGIMAGSIGINPGDDLPAGINSGSALSVGVYTKQGGIEVKAEDMNEGEVRLVKSVSGAWTKKIVPLPGLEGYLSINSVVNNLAEGGIKKPLSAEQGKALNTEIIKNKSILKGLEKEVYTTSDKVQSVVPLADGGINKSTGGGNSSLPGYRRTTVSDTNNMHPIIAARTYYYTGVMEFGVMCGVAFYDSGKVFISSSCSETKNYVDERLEIPTGAIFMAACSKGSDPIIKYEIYESMVNKALGASATNSAGIAALQTIATNNTSAVRANSLSISDLDKELFVKSDKVILSAAYVDGAIRKENGAATSSGSALYRRTSVSILANMYAIVPGRIYFYNGIIDSNTFCGVAFYDSSGLFISAACTDLKTYSEERLIIPFNAAYFGASSKGSDAVIKWETQSSNLQKAKDDASAATTLVKEILPEVYDYLGITGAVTTGALRKTGGTAINADYKRTSNSNANMFKVQPGKKHFYSGVIDNDLYAGVCYYDAAFSFLGYECGDTKIYSRTLLTIPNNAVYIGSCSKTTDPIIEITASKNTGGQKVIYVNQAYTGSSSKGTLAEPFKTIADAMNAHNTGTTDFIVLSGKYRETLPVALLNSGKYRIIGKEGEDVKILGSNQLTGWTATAGRAGVYEIPFSGEITVFDKMGGALIFEDGNPSMEIEARHYHPLQRNLRYRLPFTPIKPVATLDLVQSTPNSYIVVDGKMYMRPNGNPANNGFSYEWINKQANTYVTAQAQTKVVDLDLKNIQFMYCTRGFNASGLNKNRRYGCSALAIAGAGAWENKSGYIETWFEEAGYSNNDGENSHFSSGFPGYLNLLNNRCNFPTVVHNFLWCHDNGDDGESSHENHNVVINTGLLEFNGDSGSRPSNDATYVYNNVVARKNGWEVTNNWAVTTPSRGGEGFSVCNPVLSPARMGCRAILNNCISEENNVGFAAISQASNYLEANNCTGRNNYTEIYASAGTVIARNMKVTNASGNIKVTANLGVIIVTNDNILL